MLHKKSFNYRALYPACQLTCQLASTSKFKDMQYNMYEVVIAVAICCAVDVRAIVYIFSMHAKCALNRKYIELYHMVGRLYNQGWPGLSIYVIYYKTYNNSVQIQDFQPDYGCLRVKYYHCTQRHLPKQPSSIILNQIRSKIYFSPSSFFLSFSESNSTLAQLLTFIYTQVCSILQRTVPRYLRFKVISTLQKRHFSGYIRTKQSACRKPFCYVTVYACANDDPVPINDIVAQIHSNLTVGLQATQVNCLRHFCLSDFNPSAKT